MTGEREEREGHEDRLRDPEVWVALADQHWYVASLLEGHLAALRAQQGVPAVMVEGTRNGSAYHQAMAIELAAKAAHVRENPAIIKRGGFDSESLGSAGGHGLLALVRPLLTERQAPTLLLNKMTEHIFWAAKYPAPRRGPPSPRVVTTLLAYSFHEEKKIRDLFEALKLRAR